MPDEKDEKIQFQLSEALKKSWNLFLQKMAEENMAEILKAIYLFREELSEYLVANKMEEIGKDQLLELLSKLIKTAPLKISHSSLVKLDLLALELVDFNKKAPDDRFMGEGNLVAKKFNRTLSTLEMITNLAARDLNLKTKDRVGIRKDDKDYRLAEQFSDDLTAQSKRVLQLIKSIINEKAFWATKTKIRITGIDQMHKEFEGKDIQKLNPTETAELLTKIFDIALERVELHRNRSGISHFFHNLFGPRHVDTQAFYDDILYLNAALKTGNFNNIETKIKAFTESSRQLKP